MKCFTFERKLQDEVAFDGEEDEQPNAHLSAHPHGEEPELAQTFAQIDEFILEQDGDEPLAQSDRVGDAQHAEVVPNRRAAEAARELEVRERDDVEDYSAREHDRADYVVHIEVDRVEEGQTLLVNDNRR